MIIAIPVIMINQKTQFFNKPLSLKMIPPSIHLTLKYTSCIHFSINKNNPTAEDFSLIASLNDIILSCSQNILEWTCQNPTQTSGTLEINLTLNIALEPTSFDYTLMFSNETGGFIPTASSTGPWIPPGGMCKTTGCTPGYYCLREEGELWGECVKLESIDLLENEAKSGVCQTSPTYRIYFEITTLVL